MPPAGLLTPAPLRGLPLEGGEYLRGERSVKVLGHLEDPAIYAKRPAGTLRLSGDQASNRHARARNSNLLSCRYALQEP